MRWINYFPEKERVSEQVCGAHFYLPLSLWDVRGGKKWLNKIIQQNVVHVHGQQIGWSNLEALEEKHAPHALELLG